MKKFNLIRTTILAGTIFLQLHSLCFHSRGAAGDVDLSFDPGSGVNGPVNAVAVQPDGKVIIVGQFTTVRGLERSNIARLNPDGSSDPTFNPITAYNPLYAVALQPDGKLLVGGQFLETDCDPEWGCSYPPAVVRLNVDGSLDGSFSPAIAHIYAEFVEFRSLVPQPDGKVVVGGYFNEVNGASRNGIARLNADGSLDEGFDPGTGIAGHQGRVMSVAVQADGKTLIGGTFTSVDGIVRNGFARLNADGSLDSEYNPGAELGGSRVESLVLLSDGKVLIGGYFSTGNSMDSIARVNANGTIDQGFTPGTGANGVVSAVAMQPDGKVLIGGYFTGFDGVSRNRIARLNTNGSLDESFDPGTGINAGVSSVIVQPDGKLLLGGNFNNVNGTNRNFMARLDPNGSLDVSFDAGAGLNRAVFSVSAQQDGKVLFGHQATTEFGGIFTDAVSVFTFFNGTNQYGSGRLNADGSLDNAFISAGFNPNLADLIQYNDCVDDPRYSCQVAVIPVALRVQADGKVVISGYIQTTVAGGGGDEGGGVFLQYERLFIARYNADGNRDASFEITMGNPPDYQRVSALAVQPDGKIVVGGSFTSLKGTARFGMARLNADGTLDSSFDPGTGVTANNGNVSSVILQQDGKIIIAGRITVVNGTSRNGVARLNADGSLDHTFDPGTGVEGTPAVDLAAALQPDGKLLIGGSFTGFNGVNRNGIARLNADGSLDLSFNPGTGADARVRSIALQSDGNVIIGGDFLTFNGLMRRYMARLYGDSLIVPSLDIAGANGFLTISWPASATGFQLQESTNLSSGSWSAIIQPAVTNAGQISVTLPTSAGSKFFRLQSQ